jgi:hypothetical protein
MKYKLGVKYFMINKGWIEGVILHSVTITLDQAGIYSEECYLDFTGAEIVIVFNKETTQQTRKLFLSEAKAIGYQIKVLKELKHKESIKCEHVSDGRQHNIERISGVYSSISNLRCKKCKEFYL